MPTTGFVPEALAKPKVLHKSGGKCLSCGALSASQWRGPGGNFCSIAKCEKAAKAAREALKADPMAERMAQRVEDLEDEMQEMKAMMAAMQAQLAQSAQERLMLSGPSGSKRPLQLATTAQPEASPAKRLCAAPDRVQDKTLMSFTWAHLLVDLREMSGCGSESVLKTRFEAAAGMPAGAVDASQELTAKWKKAMKQAAKLWEQLMAEKDERAASVSESERAIS